MDSEFIDELNTLLTKQNKISNTHYGSIELLNKYENEKEPTICLNMIVKNESKIITRLFDSVINIIDTYFICDTGSTDNTPELIKKYFNDKNIQGEIIYEPFKNFGYNRTYALEKAKQSEIAKADYLLFLDADMQLIIEPSFKKSMLKEKAYQIMQINPSISYYNLRILHISVEAKCLGATHEYYDLPEIQTHKFTDEYLHIDDIGDGGSKN